MNEERCPECGEPLPAGVACPGCGQLISSVTISVPPDDDAACAHYSDEIKFRRLADGRFVGMTIDGHTVLHECAYLAEP